MALARRTRVLSILSLLGLVVLVSKYYQQIVDNRTGHAGIIHDPVFLDVGKDHVDSKGRPAQDSIEDESPLPAGDLEVLSPPFHAADPPPPMPADLPPAEADAPPPPPTGPTLPDYCSTSSCLQGSWQPRSPLFTSIADLQVEYANPQEPMWSGCRVPAPPPRVSPPNSVEGEEGREGSIPLNADFPARTPEEQKALTEKRLLEVMNYVWKPDNGTMRPFDAEEFVVRMLKSAGGVVLVGDSITEQHFYALGYALRASGIAFQEDPPHLRRFTHTFDVDAPLSTPDAFDPPLPTNAAGTPTNSAGLPIPTNVDGTPTKGAWVKQKNVHMHILRPGTESTKRLQEKAGVGEERMKRPIFSLLEEHMWIHEPEIREITHALGAPESYPWYHDFQRVEGWEDWIKDIATFPGIEDDKGVTEDTVMLANAGAHWSRHELTMLPNPGTDAPEQDLVVATYKEMMSRITSRLSLIANLSVYYRATSPGHPTCLLPPASASIPYNALLPHPNSTVAEQLEDPSLVPARLEVSLIPSHANAEEKRGRRKWDWDLFDRHNELWRDFVQREKERREAGADTGGAKWFFLDVWNQALQRQDAHAEPGADCLHWCLPSLPEQWTRHLHHALFMEGEEKKKEKQIV